VVHLHSRHSDGTGTVPEIARAAAKAGVDVVLLTDHDTLAAKRAGEEGWHGDVLVLVGEEVSPLGHDHYLAFGIEERIRHRGMSARDICEAVRAAGGFGFAAHPWSKGSDRFKRAGTGMPFADLEAADGLELWSFVTDTVERVGSIREAVRFAAAPDRVVDHPPERNMREWDALCASRRVPAIGGLDAHQFGVRVGPLVLRAMGYARSFRQLRTHVLCDEPPTGELEHDRAQVYDALREGRCFIGADVHAPTRGFRFWAEGRRGEVTMGGEASAGEWTLHAVLPAPARLRMLRDGEPVAEREAPALVLEAREPGVYRVEARLERHGRERTWVISNPIYFR
jgi:hypothetical protein